jgi:hypothetical protein
MDSEAKKLIILGLFTGLGGFGIKYFWKILKE